MLLEKLDGNGNFIWAKLITGNHVKTPTSLSFDSASNLFVSGGFFGTADFDPGPGVYTLTCTPGASLPSLNDVFVAKYDSAGNFSWARSIGGNGDDRAWSGDVDAYGNVLVTGAFEGTVDFDPGPGVYNLTSLSTRNIFTLKLRNNGDFAWAKRMGTGGGLHEGRALTTDASGNVYTAAVSPGGCDLDPGPAVHNVSGDCVLQKLDSAGNYVWGVGWQGDVPGWVGVDKTDGVYITGAFRGFNKDFDPGPAVYPLSGMSGNNFSGFILKLKDLHWPVGVSTTRVQAAVSVYPNPSTGMVRFAAPAPIKHLQITDLSGRLVYSAMPQQSTLLINLEGQRAGVYFYELDCGEGKQSGKVLIYKAGKGKGIIIPLRIACIL